MTEKKTDENMLNDYLSGKSRLSELYQEIPAAEPGASTDARILAAAKDARHAKLRVFELTSHNWNIPVAIAAMLLIGVSLVWWQVTETPEPEVNIRSSAPPHDPSIPQQIDETLQQNLAAEQWLDEILKLHQAGNQQQAASEWKRFRATHPGYSIDAQRHEVLLSYDK